MKIVLLPATLLAVIVAMILTLAINIKAVSAGEKMDIVDTAVAAGNFDTLVTAVKAARLVDTLKGEGPFTVFAPTDQAFAQIPGDQLNTLLDNKEALTKVLTYHVVLGKLMATEVMKMNSVETLQGQPLTIDASSEVKVNNARVIKTDIETSNGIIHVIDAVLMPN